MKQFFVNHSTIVRHIAKKYNLDPDRVNHTIRVFLGFRGIGHNMKKGASFYITGFGLFRPNNRRKLFLKKELIVKKINNRLRNKLQE